MEIISPCIYCGIGCKLKYIVEDNKIERVLPYDKDEISEGKPCIKGLTISEVVDSGRILKPMKRINGKLKEISWEEALFTIYKLISKYSPEEIFFTGSGKITNEDNYIIQKFARVVVKTNNIDGCCSRLCHMPSVIAYRDTFGISANPYLLKDIYKVDYLLILGSNPASNYPSFFSKIMKNRRNMKIVVISPVYSETTEFADKVVLINPGTEILLLNWIIKEIIERKAFRRKISGLEELYSIVSEYNIKDVEEICGVKRSEINEIVEGIIKCKCFGAIHGMGITQRMYAVETVQAILNLVVLMNGKILSGRGEINVQGSGDMLTIPQPIQFHSDVNLENLKKIWKCELPKEKGMNIIEAICFGNAKVSFIVGFNPAQSLPDLNKVHKNLKRMFLVQVDSYFNLTSYFADLILPIPLLIEREGTITNCERRVEWINKVRQPPGLCKNTWEIFKEVARAFGIKGFEYGCELEILDEITKIIKSYSSIDVKKIKEKDYFADKKIKYLKLIPTRFIGVDKQTNSKYPFLLYTFRSKYNFLTNEATGKSKTLNKGGYGPYFYINVEDAKKMKIKSFDEVIVESTCGKVKGYVVISEKVRKGFIGAHFHFENLLVNKLYPLQFDNRSFTPNFKFAAVRVKKVK